jgi:aminoacrylate peracid reductase
MRRKPIYPENAPRPLAPYTPGIRVGNTIYVSGMLALDEKGELVGKGDVAAQTRRVIELVEQVLKAEGASLRDIAFNAIFLKDLGDYAAMNAVYREYFSQEPPARYCIRADLVKPDFLVEIASTAHIGER